MNSYKQQYFSKMLDPPVLLVCNRTMQTHSGEVSSYRTGWWWFTAASFSQWL